MMGNYHVSCGVGEKLEITSNAYLLLTILVQGIVSFLVIIVNLIGEFSEWSTVFFIKFSSLIIVYFIQSKNN